MDDHQKNAIHNHGEAIIDCIEAHLVHAIIDFTDHGTRTREMHVLKHRDTQIIKMQPTPYGQTTELIRLLQCRETGFQALTAALRCYGRADLAATLDEESTNPVTCPAMGKCSAIDVLCSTKQPTFTERHNSTERKFISDLKHFTRQYCQVIRQHWKDSLAVDDLEHAYVPLTIANEKQFSPKHKWNEDDLQSLAFLYVDEVRIFITGEPGFGKSTFLNKIAYDWATDKNPALTKHFDFIYYLPLSEATGNSLSEAILAYLAFDDKENSSAVISRCFADESYRSRTLFLLDAYDEANLTSFPALSRIAEGRENPLTKCVITSRPLQVANLQKPIHISARGFDASAQSNYMTKHMHDEGLRAHILDQKWELLSSPFFLTVVCLLANQNKAFNFQGQSALFELLKEYHEWLYFNAVENKKMLISLEDYKLTLIEAGKFALQEILQSGDLENGKELVKRLNGSVESSIDHRLLKSAAQLGVMTVRTVRIVIHLRSPDSVAYGFLHKLLAEYLCAVHLNYLISLRKASWWGRLTSTCVVAKVLLKLLLGDYDHFGMVSYFLSGLSKDYFHAIVQHLLRMSENQLSIPSLCDTFKLPEYKSRILRGCCQGRDWPDTAVSTTLLAALLSGGSDDSNLFIYKLCLQIGWLSIAVQYENLQMGGCTIFSDESSQMGTASKLSGVDMRRCRIHSFTFLHHLTLHQLSLEDVYATDEAWLQLFTALHAGLSASLQVFEVVNWVTAWQISANVVGQLPAALAHMQTLRHLQLGSDWYTDGLLSALLHDLSGTLEVLILHLPHHSNEEEALIKKQLSQTCTKLTFLRVLPIW